MKEKNKGLIMRWMFTIVIFLGFISIFHHLLGSKLYWLANIMSSIIGTTFFFKSKELVKGDER